MDGVERHLRRLLGGVEDRARRIFPGGPAAVAGLRHGVDVGPAGVQRHIHVGELALHQLEGADRLAELLALVDVGQHHVEAGLHDSEGPGREHRSLVIEPGHQHPHPAVHRPEHILLRHLAVLEHEFAGV